MMEAVIQGETVDVQDRISKMKRLEKRVARQNNHGIFRYLGIFGLAAVSYLGMDILSTLDDIRIYKYGSLALLVVMLLMILPLGDRSRLPFGCIATFFAMAAGTIILLLDPFHSADMPVYIVTLVIMAGVIWECLELLKLYNKSCSNTLPQFESHQGGELL